MWYYWYCSIINVNNVPHHGVHYFCRMFGMVVEKLFVAEAQKVSGNVERKICAVGMIKILTDAAVMLVPDYDKLW